MPEASLSIVTAFLLAAQAAPAAAPSPAVPAAVSKTERVCRYEGETGSRLGGKKRCQTRAQWEAEFEANRREHGSQRGYGRSGTN